MNSRHKDNSKLPPNLPLFPDIPNINLSSGNTSMPTGNFKANLEFLSSEMTQFSKFYFWQNRLETTLNPYLTPF